MQFCFMLNLGVQVLLRSACLHVDSIAWLFAVWRVVVCTRLIFDVRMYPPFIAGHLETADASSYGTYVFRRCDFDRCLPYALFPCAKPTLMVRVCPVKYKLRTDTDEVFIDLPYRLVFAVMCSESIYFYDTQTNVPIGFVYDISYDNLTR